MSDSEQKAFQQLKQSIEDNKELIKKNLEGGKDKFFELVKSFVAKLDPQKAALYTGLAYLGYENLSLGTPLFKMMWGIVGMELATTPSEGGSASLSLFGVQFPVNSQIAGLGMLATLGFDCLPWERVSDIIKKQVDEEKDIVHILMTWLSGDKEFLSDSTRQGLQESLNAILHRTKPRDQAIREARAWIEAANAELQAYVKDLPREPFGPDLPPDFVPPLVPPPPANDAQSLLRQILAEYGDVMTPEDQAKAYELSLTGYQFLWNWSRGMSTIWKERKGEL